MGSLFDQYRQSFERDGADASILTNAVGAERDELESDLIAYLDVDAASAADALWMMKSTNAAPHLRVAMEGADAATRAHIARALLFVEDDSSWIEPIAKAINDQTISALARTRLISLLYRVKHPEAFAALESAMLDHDHFVRRSAAFFYSRNSAKRTADSTIQNNVGEYDEARIRRFIEKMRAKIDG